MSKHDSNVHDKLSSNKGTFLISGIMYRLETDPKYPIWKRWDVMILMGQRIKVTKKKKKIKVLQKEKINTCWQLLVCCILNPDIVAHIFLLSKVRREVKSIDLNSFDWIPFLFLPASSSSIFQHITTCERT